MPRSIPLALLVVPLLLACIWDRDTLEMETRTLPTALELITGRFPRHSDEYYRWRIEDRTEKLAAEPENLAWIDDLAAAHDKLGEHATAIALMTHSLELSPDRYESLANRGTFRIHAGDLEAGLEDIRAAIRVNPDAHFGREIVQQRLVEYLLRERAAGRGALPLTEPAWAPGSEFGFERFRAALDPPLPRTEAIRGLLGMMRFGHHDHPVLLDVLGEQLHADGHKRLAARAYLLASYGAEDEGVRVAYRERAKAALSTQTPAPGQDRNISLEAVEESYREELEIAERSFERIREDERRWIESGEDVDARFDAKYLEESRDAASAYRSLLLLVGGLVVCAGILSRSK